MQRLLLMGLNHATAPLEVREQVAFTPDQRREALGALREKFPDAEAVLISTCNRVELYVARPVHQRPKPEDLMELLASSRNASADVLSKHVYHKAERDAIEHLFSVTSSVDSMVIGETQILGQVREAYESAHELGLTGAELNPLFQKALAVGKQVLTETAIAEGHVSVASVAVDCAHQIFEHFDDKTVLSIGAGKMATLVLQSFAALKPRRLLICNRDTEKALALSPRFAGEPCGFDKLDDHLTAADIVISSTASTDPIITRQRFESLLKHRRYRPIFLIDIALPRDIEASVGKLENVYLYNIDDLQQVVSSSRSNRSDSIDAARKIISQQVDHYIAWNHARAMGPMIDKLFQKHHDLARQELDRTLAKLPGLSANDRAQLEELTRRIVNKLLHDPIKSLRDSDHTPGTPYLHALQKLFHLEDETSETSHEQSED